MEEYKSHIGIALRSGTVERETLEVLSISCLSMIQDNKDDLQTPCWLCIINKVALDALHDPDGKFTTNRRCLCTTRTFFG